MRMGDGSLPVRSRDKAPVRCLGDFVVPQKLKQNVKLVYNI